MEKRNITFVEGNVARYHLSAGRLSQLLLLLPQYYREISKTVYYVESLDLLKEEYNKLPSPVDGDGVSEICFFEGKCCTVTLSDYQLRMGLDRVKKEFCYSEIAKDIYKISEIKYLN